MSFFDKFKTNKKFNGIHSQRMMIPPNLNIQQYLSLYGEIGYLYAGVNRIAQAVADSELEAFNKKGEKVNSLALDVLKKPNEFTSLYELIQSTDMMLSLTGTAYWYIARDNRFGLPREIHLINPMYITIVPDVNNFIKGYIYRAGTQDIPLDSDEVIFFNMPNPLNPYSGTSPLKALSTTLEQEKYAEEWNRNFFYNNATPNGVITSDKPINDTMFNRLREQWNGRYGGKANAHKTAILENGLKFTTTGFSQKDMDFSNLKTMNREEILAVLGVPKVLIGLTDGVNYATAQTQEQLFYKNTVKPRLRLIQEKINNEFMPLFRIENDIEIKFKEVMLHDREYVKSILDSQVGKSITVNEAREVLGSLLGRTLEPVEGGDKLGVNYSFNFSDIEEEENIENNDTSSEKIFKKEVVNYKSVDNSKKKEITRFANKQLKKKEILESFEAKLTALMIALEKDFIKDLIVYFTNQEKDVVNAVEEAIKKDEVVLTDNIITDMALIDIAEKHIKRAFEMGGNLAIELLDNSLRPIAYGFGVDFGLAFNVKDPNVIEQLNKSCELITRINDTTRSKVRDIILESYNSDSFSVKDVKKRLEQSGLFNSTRAKVIAQTETARAINTSNYLAYTQNEIVDKKAWLTNADELVRPAHSEAGSTYTVDNAIGINEMFIVGGEEGLYPNAPTFSAKNSVNCRCCLMPIIDIQVEET